MEKKMRISGQDPYCLIKNSKLLAKSLDRRTRWRCLTVMVIALAANPDVHALGNLILKLGRL